VSTGQFSHSDNTFMGSGSRDMYNGINTFMPKFVAGMSSGKDGTIVQSTVVQGTVTKSNQTYKVGDTGPAGGIIFYDKGEVSEGWRYLEAAPANSEFTAEWGTYKNNVANTKPGGGYGKQNTRIIVDRLKELREFNKAAQLCAIMEINGYKDWFLPSKEELDVMYKNLKQKGLGGFSDVYYWSSSSSEYGSDYNACSQNFESGYQGSASKNSSLSVRAIRAF